MNNQELHLCECGCGRPTKIATRTTTKFGHVKGQPLRFIVGHQAPVPDEDLYAVDPESGCWIWKGWLDKDGYGHIRRQGKYYGAHRYFYEKANGSLPKGAQMHHTCHNPACVNPSHLEVVSPLEHRRLSRNVRLNPDLVQEIRRLRHEGALYREICERLDLSHSHPRQVCIGALWGDV